MRTTNGEMAFSREGIGMEAILRTYCYMVISQLPLAGLEEMSQSLTDALDFYDASGGERESVEPARRQVTGSLVGSYNRPISYF